MKKMFFPLMTILSLALFTVSCKKDKGGSGTNAPVANFTSVVTGLSVAFTNTSAYYTASSWNFGDGSAASTTASPSHTYAAAGTWHVTLEVTGSDGTKKSVTKDVVTTGGGSVDGPNVVVSGDFSDPTKWTGYTVMDGSGVPADGVSVNYTGGKANFTGGANGTIWGHYVIYQKVTVEAGKTYQIDADVTGGADRDQSWFEVWVSNVAPTTGADYAGVEKGGIRLDLNTWNCPGAFSGKFSLNTCTLGAWNTITGLTAGDAYIVIKGGGVALGAAGITIDNVDLHSIN